MIVPIEYINSRTCFCSSWLEMPNRLKISSYDFNSSSLNIQHKLFMCLSTPLYHYLRRWGYLFFTHHLRCSCMAGISVKPLHRICELSIALTTIHTDLSSFLILSMLFQSYYTYLKSKCKQKTTCTF